MKIVDIHCHGGFGVNFNTATLSKVEYFAKRAKEFSTFGFCPTLATDSIENIQRQLAVFNEFKNSSNDGAKMLGVHLEGIFLNPKKAGIHNQELFLTPSVENFKRVIGDFLDVIKIVTLAPELDCGLIDYLNQHNIRVHAGHTLAKNSKRVCATTHHFNAMPTLSHRESTITLDGLLNDIYCEIIADGEHVSDDMLKLFFKVKDENKIILVSDSLPIAHSDLNEIEFCGQRIFANGKNSDGTLAGSVVFLCDIVDRLVKKEILQENVIQKMVWDNPIRHLGLKELYE